ncbi:MAG: NAD(P)-dependent oxidoreductase [Rhodobacteraceae bacterium]|nr:NAD(P)-dependent oxidoreductase [Paracoccaceae bacterium]
MGAGMLRSLRRAGLDARGYDIRPLPDIGTDPEVFAAGLTHLISVVRDEPQTDDLLFGAGNVIALAPGLRTITISSTISPRYVRALRVRIPAHIALIDAPMSGAQAKAEDGTLSFMLGGEDADITTLMPAFEAMGSTLNQIGPLGAGMTAKVMNNMIAAASLAATRLALDWADAAGLDEAKMLEVFNSSSGQTWISSGIDTVEFARHGYEPDNSVGLLVKDVAAAMDAAPEGADLALPKQLQAQIKQIVPRPKQR